MPWEFVTKGWPKSVRRMPGRSSNWRKSPGSRRDTPASLNRTQPFGLPSSRSASSPRAPSAPSVAADQALVVARGVNFTFGSIQLG